MGAGDMSVFLKVDPKHRVLENGTAFALYDIHPVSEGHMLIIPKRQFSNFFDATDEEILGQYNLLKEAKTLLDKKHKPDGFNVGINVGPAAGQTVFHAHIHLIPRYAGETPEDTEHVKGIFQK